MWADRPLWSDITCVPQSETCIHYPILAWCFCLKWAEWPRLRTNNEVPNSVKITQKRMSTCSICMAEWPWSFFTKCILIAPRFIAYFLFSVMWAEWPIVCNRIWVPQYDRCIYHHSLNGSTYVDRVAVFVVHNINNAFKQLQLHCIFVLLVWAEWPRLSNITSVSQSGTSTLYRMPTCTLYMGTVAQSI